MKVFLDDVRDPMQVVGYMYKRIGRYNILYTDTWHIVRDYEAFVKFISENFEAITHVSFDHDLADVHYNPNTWTGSFKYEEQTGYDCAVWMKDFYALHGLKLPMMFVHSMNPVGTERIIKLFNSRAPQEETNP